jgi:transcriptional regulator with XRE-family HTH domain
MKVEKVNRRYFVDSFKDYSFSNMLKELIEKSGKSIAELANDAGIASGYLSMLRSGKKTAPGDPVVLGLARALELDSHTTGLFHEAARKGRSVSPAPKVKHVGGIVGVHAALPEEEFKKWICDATKRVCILETWITNPIRFKDAFIEVAKKHASDPDFTTQILLLDPSASSAEQRSKDIWISRTSQIDAEDIARYASKKIQDSLDDFKMLRRIINDEIRIRNNVDKECMEIRTHKCLPSFSIYLCDDKAFIGFYVHGDFSNAVPQLEVNLSIDTKSGSFAHMINSEFETLWMISTSSNSGK